MGRPKESNMGDRLRCCKCNNVLPPCKSFDDLYQTTIHGRHVHVFNGGEYYRPVGYNESYECDYCFYKPIREQEQMRREEERRREEKRRREEERKMKEEQQRAKEAEEKKKQLSQSAWAMIEPLKSGLRSFNNVSEILLSVKADLILPGCQTFSDIRRQIENMKQQMEKSEQVAREELQRIDEETERLTAEQSDLASQKKQRESELGDLKKHLESHRSLEQNYTQALETARRNLRSAENTLSNMREKRDQAQRVRDAGIGVSFIPIVGLIAGPVMVGVGQTDMNQASDAADVAKREVENCESQMKTYSDKVSDFNNLIYQTQRQIQEADNKIKETAAKLQGVSVKRRVVADLQAKTRQAVHHLGLLCGVGSVAELQTRRLILLEPVMKAMEEMTTALGHITGDQLLNTEGIKSLMGDMKKNQNKLKQLADTNKQSDEDMYH